MTTETIKTASGGMEAIQSFWTPNTIVTIGIIIVGILSILIISFPPKKFRRLYEKSKAERASLATSAGIAFTFLGITIALFFFNFDAANLDSSIGNLINGLKIAFITSLVGVVCATILKIQHKSEKGAVYSGKTDNELLQGISESLVTLNKNLYGEEEGSLLGQIKLLRQENSDSNKNLVKSIDAFAEKVAQNQTEELVKALESVLENLEKTIQEKLGESFRQFSESVDNLVQWQEGYKDNIEKTQEVLNQVKDSMSEVAGSFENIAEQNKQVQEVQENLKGIIEALFKELKSIEEQTELLSRLPGDFESIAANISKMGEDMETSAQAHREQMQRIVESVASNVEEMGSAMKESIDKVGADIEVSAQAHREQMQRMVQSVASNVEEMGSAMKESIDKVGADIKTSASFHKDQTERLLKEIQEGSGKINKQYGELIHNIQNQVPKLTGELDEHLARTVGGFRSTLEEALNHLNDTLNQINKSGKALKANNE